MSTPVSDSSKLSNQLLGNPITWLAITLLITLVAYIWMDQITEELPVVAIKKVLSEDVSPNFEPTKTQNTEIKQETLQITRETDSERVQEYLAIEALEDSVDPFMQSAQLNISQGRYVLPAGQNAWEDYQQVLFINAQDNKAKNGLTKIRNLLIDKAEKAIEIGDFADSENWLVQLDVIQPDDELQKDLRSDIKTQIALRKLLQKCGNNR